MLRRQGELVNRKRVHRVYRELGLAVRRRKRKKIAAAARGRMPANDPKRSLTRQKERTPDSEVTRYPGFKSGRNWIRTSDSYRVKVVLYR